MSEVIFEIFDKEGRLLKRGEVEEELNIAIQENDYRYVIRDKNDETKIYKQGYIQIARSKEQENPFPIVMLGFQDGQAEMFCNSFKNGHNVLCFQKPEDPSTKTEIMLESPRLVFEIEPGEYLFYTRNEQETTKPVRFIIAKETKEELLNKIKNNIKDFSQQHEAVLLSLQSCLEEDKSLQVYEAAQKVYLDTPKEDIELLTAAYELLYQSERILNTRRQLNNEQGIRKTELISAPQEFIRVGPEIDKVIVYVIQNNNPMYFNTIWTESNKEQVVSLREDRPHKLELYSGDNLVNSFDLFCPDKNIKPSLWTIAKEAIDKTDEVQERRFLIFNNQTDISDGDKKKLSIELYKKPFYEIVSAPDVVLNDNEMEIYIQDFERLRRLDKRLCLSIKELPYVFYPNKENRIPIEDSVIKVQYVQDGLYPDKEYFIWVEDEKHNVLSSLRFISSDLEKMDTYNSTSRMSHIKAYRERVIGYLSNYYNDVYNILKEEIDHLSAIADVSPNNLYKSLIARLSKNKDTRLFNNMASLILQDYYSNFLVNERFFGGKMVLDKKRGILTFPERFFEYIVQVDSFDVGDQQAKTTYYNIKENGAIKLEDSDYFIVSAIDKNDYSKSGFVFFNTFKIDTVLASWKLGIEVK